MRCKVGDICVIVDTADTYIEYLGRICTIVKPEIYRGNHVWEIDLKHKDGDNIIISDNGLRPLRDNPGQDETLQWAPVPHKEAA